MFCIQQYCIQEVASSYGCGIQDLACQCDSSGDDLALDGAIGCLVRGCGENIDLTASVTTANRCHCSMSSNQTMPMEAPSTPEDSISPILITAILSSQEPLRFTISIVESLVDPTPSTSRFPASFSINEGKGYTSASTTMTPAQSPSSTDASIALVSSPTKDDGHTSASKTMTLEKSPSSTDISSLTMLDKKPLSTDASRTTTVEKWALSTIASRPTNLEKPPPSTNTTSASSSRSNQSHLHSDTKIGAIAGGVISGIVLVLAAARVAFLMHSRKHHKKYNKNKNSSCCALHPDPDSDPNAFTSAEMPISPVELSSVTYGVPGRTSYHKAELESN